MLLQASGEFWWEEVAFCRGTNGHSPRERGSGGQLALKEWVCEGLHLRSLGVPR